MFFRNRIVVNVIQRSLATSTGAIGVKSAGTARPWKKIVFGAFGVGAAIGGYLTFDEYRRTLNANKPIMNSSDSSDPPKYLLLQAPDVPASRSIRYPTDNSGLKVTVFQYQTCPFSCKVRAVLEFLKISHDIVEVNPVLRTQLKWSKDYKKVPIVIVETPDGKVFQLNDSSMITSALCSLWNTLHANPSVASPDSVGNELLKVVKCYPTMNFREKDGSVKTDIQNKYFLMNDGLIDGSPESRQAIMDERKWRAWADNVYVHTLSPNIYRDMPEALDSFRYFDQVGEWEKHFALWERYLVIYMGAAAMWIIGKRLKSRHNLKNEVRESLYDESNVWMKNVKNRGGKFMGGEEPNLADIAVYGVLSSIEGCKAFGDLKQKSKIVEDWYYPMKEYVHRAV